MIFFYSRKTATATGSVIKTVECEHCHAQFSFPFKCEAVGTAIAPYFLFGGWAEQRAENRATKKLEKRLAQETEAVPCPACGRFQRDMVRQFAKRIANLSMVWVVLAWVVIGIACVSIEIKHSKHEIDWTYPS